MSAVRSGRFCALFLVFFVFCSIGSLELACAKKHGRRATEYTYKEFFSDSLRNRKFHKADRNDKDSKKSSVSDNNQKPAKIVAKTFKGKYRGYLQNVLDTKVATFLGMRYAEAPTGNKRFKKPVPPQKWMDTKDAMAYPNSCYQWRDETFAWFQKDYRGTEMWNANTPLSEDCLFLNVWSPLSSDFCERKMPTKGPLLPVMIWIYGGGFYSGTSSLDVYDGKFLAASEGVLVVSLNYRVAALGFLTFGIEDAPGNAGLWDQNLALHWVRKNIRHFRGDPDRITLFGESAGAASISAHILSSHSNTLFQNAILQSASILSPWAVIPTDIMRKRAINLSVKLGCLPEPKDFEVSKQEMIECMRNISAQKMVDVEIGMEDLGTARFQNAIVIDEDFLTKEAFEQLKRGKFSTSINIIAGFNKNEGNYFLVYSTDGYTNLTDSGAITYSQYRNGLARALWGYPGQPMNAEEAKDDNPSNFTLDAIDFEYTNFQESLNDRKKCEVVEKELSCTSKISKNDYKDQLDQITGDTAFVCSVIDFMKKTNSRDEADSQSDDGSADNMQEKGMGRKYVYNFLPRSSQTPWPEWMGTLHGYEIEFTLGSPLNPTLNYTQEEVKLAKMMMKLWASMAKRGNPNLSDNKSSRSRPRDTHLIEWHEYDDDTEAVLIFSIEPAEVNSTVPKAVVYMEEKVKSKHCRFWNDYYPVIQRNIMQAEATPCADEVSSSARSSTVSTSILGCLFITNSIYFVHLSDFS